METKSFNPQILDILRKDIDKALAEVAKKHDLASLTIKNISYTANNFRTTLEGKTKNQEVTKNRASELFKLYVGEDLIGKKFTHKGVEYTISDFNTRKRKNPIISTSADGRQVHCSIETIKRQPLK